MSAPILVVSPQPGRPKAGRELNDAIHWHPSERFSTCLQRALDELEARTAQPLRMVAHASTTRQETFEFEEEDELGRAQHGRRFFISVDPTRRDLLVVVLPQMAEAVA